MHTLENIDFSVLPEQAQNKIYELYLLLKQQHHNKNILVKQNKQRRIDRLKGLKVESFIPLCRDDIYVR
ncbi:MAG: hypothetical protein HOE77_04275 [Candidatus Marinimicrobia bacterium]|jgi:hypothetical protein|nr:hypothetical protein [Candidatus Neomarinimicrobiota bacterium]